MKKLIIILLSFTFLSSESYAQDIETFTKGFTKKEGFINYYWDGSKGKLYLEISKLEEELLYVNYLSAPESDYFGSGFMRYQSYSLI